LIAALWSRSSTVPQARAERRIIDHARGLLGDLCRAGEGALLECSGEADHLHALIDVPPKVRPSDLVNNLKTVLSRQLRKEFPAVRTA